MKILLTGRTGQIGWHLERLLPRVGETLATDRATLDLAQPDRLRAAIRAACPDVRWCFVEPDTPRPAVVVTASN